MNRTVFRIEAVILAAPAAIFSFWALPNIFLWVVVGIFALLDGDSSLQEVLVVPAIFSMGIFGLYVLAKLVIATSTGRPFRFGILFWLGLLCGLLLGIYLHIVFAPALALVVVLPLLLLAAHATYIQLSKSQLVIQPDGPASGGSAS
jgi:hypothetical protein